MFLEILKEEKRKVTVKHFSQHLNTLIIFTIFYGFSIIVWQRFILFFIYLLLFLGFI